MFNYDKTFIVLLLKQRVTSGSPSCAICYHRGGTIYTDVADDASGADAVLTETPFC